MRPHRDTAGPTVDRLPDGFERRTVEVDGAHLSVTVGGAGAPVLLLHGWPQTSDAWRPVMAPLAAQGWRVIVPDLRGTGESERTANGYAKDDQAEDVRRLLEQLDATTPVRLVGHDIGGMVAFSFARLHPDRVARLVLVDLAVPGLGLEEAMDVAHGGRWHFGLFMQPQVPDMLIAGHEDEFFSWWFTVLSGRADALPRDVVEGYTRAYTGRDALAAGFGHYRTLLADGDVNRAWVADGGSLPMPVLAVGGQHSAGLHLAASLRGVAPRLEGVAVPGAGHFVIEEAPERFLGVLQRFLADG